MKTLFAVLSGVLGAGLCVATFTGCSSDNLPEVGFTDNLRILAIKASPVAVRAGSGPVTFTALVADPKGAGRNVTYTWDVCLPTQLDATGTRCATTITTSTATTASLTPQFAYTNTFTGAAAVVVTLSAAAGSEFRAGLRTLSVVETTGADIAAPSLGALRINNTSGVGAVALAAGATYDVDVTVSSGATAGGFVTWVTDGGELSAARTSSYTNKLSPPNVAGSYKVYSIYNDGTGGVDFLTRAFTVP